jgi:hypothetical protein
MTHLELPNDLKDAFDELMDLCEDAQSVIYRIERGKRNIERRIYSQIEEVTDDSPNRCDTCHTPTNSTRFLLTSECMGETRTNCFCSRECLIDGRF